MRKTKRYYQNMFKPTSNVCLDYDCSRNGPQRTNHGAKMDPVCRQKRTSLLI